MPKPVLREVFPDWQSGEGIFYYLAELGPLPWSEDESVDQTVLDVAYFGNHSGGKFCSPLVEHLLDDDGVLPAAACETIAKILLAKYKPNWFHLWETNTVAYNPIHNYDMTEIFGKTKTTSVYGQHTDTIGQIQDTHSVAPFNSTVPQVESQDTTAQRTDTIGTHTDTVDGDAVTNTRKGNIGVQTAGDIARVFTDFWSNHYKFMSMIFDDIVRQLLFVGD